MFHVKRMDQIIYELKVLNKNMEKAIGLLQPQETAPAKKKTNKKTWTSNRFLSCLKGRYKTIDEIMSDLSLSRETAKTYLRFARAAGYVFETKPTKNGRSYKLKKGQLND